MQQLRYLGVVGPGGRRRFSVGFRAQGVFPCNLGVCELGLDPEAWNLALD